MENNPKITKIEFIAGIFLVAGVLALGVLITDNIKGAMEREFLRYEQAIKLKDATQFDYAVKTNAGDILAEGLITSEQSQTMPDIKGEYSAIERVDEEYREHSRQVSYSCGTAKAPRTCYRTEVYWTWDYIGGESKRSKTYKVLNTSLDNICTPPRSGLNLNENYTGDKRHDQTYIYPKPDWLGNGDFRTYYTVTPKEFNGTVFLRAFGGQIKNPLNDSCVQLFYNDTIDKVVEYVRPDFFFITFCLIIIVSGVLVAYFYWAAVNEF